MNLWVEQQTTLKTAMLNDVLCISVNNAKHHNDSINLPAGKSCPSALTCRAHVEIVNNTTKMIDGKFSTTRCFSATSELRRDVYNICDYNFKMLRSCNGVNGMYDLLKRSINTLDFKPFRIHDDGDFFNQKYFDAWLQFAIDSLGNEKIFYAYTKSIPYWINRINDIPKNLRLIASYGGVHDELIREYNLISARIIFHPDEALKLNLPIDKHDNIAIRNNTDFCLLIHGTQKAGSKSSKAKSFLEREFKRTGDIRFKSGYTRK